MDYGSIGEEGYRFSLAFVRLNFSCIGVVYGAVELYNGCHEGDIRDGCCGSSLNKSYVSSSDQCTLHSLRHALDCGACGYENCKEFEKTEKRAGLDFMGAICFFKAFDLRIAFLIYGEDGEYN